MLRMRQLTMCSRGLVVLLASACSDGGSPKQLDVDDAALPSGAAAAMPPAPGGGSGGTRADPPVRELDGAVTPGDTSASRDAAAKEDGSLSAPDAGRMMVAAEPVAPCSDELDAQPGVVAPDFGAPQPATTFDGDPNDMGPFDVMQADTTITNPDASGPALDATFYAPSSDQGSSVAGELHPLVVVMHGFGATHRNYEHFTQHMASYGLLVLGITLPGALVAVHDKNADEAIAAIDYALSSAVPAAIAGHVDPERIAIAGHSFGGKIAFYAAARDPRIDLVIGWDPSNAGGPPCFIDAAMCNAFPVAPNCMANDSGIVHELQAETLIFRAAADGTNPEPAHGAIHFYRGVPAPATLLDFDANVSHADFANPDAAVSPHARRVQLAFLLSRFSGVTGLEDYLPGGTKIGDDPLLVRVLSR